MKRLLIASILLTGCAPSYHIGIITEIDPYVRRVTVQTAENHYMVVFAEERDTLSLEDTVMVENFKIIK